MRRACDQSDASTVFFVPANSLPLFDRVQSTPSVSDSCLYTASPGEKRAAATISHPLPLCTFLGFSECHDLPTVARCSPAARRPVATKGPLHHMPLAARRLAPRPLTPLHHSPPAAGRLEHPSFALISPHVHTSLPPPLLTDTLASATPRLAQNKVLLFLFFSAFTSSLVEQSYMS